jgi:hypothetical protein
VTESPPGSPNATRSSTGADTALSTAVLPNASDRIREALKWLITTFAAIGAVLVAGSQLSSLGTLDTGSGRFVAAAVGIVLGFIGIAIAIWRTAVILVDGSYVTLSGLVRQPQSSPLDKLIRQNSDLLQGQATSVMELRDRWIAATHQRKLAFDDYYNNPGSAELMSRAEVASAKLAIIDRAVSNLLDVASFETLRLSAKRNLPWIFAGVLSAALGIVLFAWAANPRPTQAQAATASAGIPGDAQVLPQVTLILEEAGIARVEAGIGEKCARRRMDAVILGIEATAKHIVVLAASADCSPYRMMLTPELGFTVST